MSYENIARLVSFLLISNQKPSYLSIVELLDGVQSARRLHRRRVALVRNPHKLLLIRVDLDDARLFRRVLVLQHVNDVLVALGVLVDRVLRLSGQRLRLDDDELLLVRRFLLL